MKTYSELNGRSNDDNLLYSFISDLRIKKEYLLTESINSTYELITPTPFNTSVIDPSLVLSENFHASTSIVCNIFYKFSEFASISERWNIIKLTEKETGLLKQAILQLGKIALEPVEDIAFNIRFIAVLQNNRFEKASTQNISFSSQFLPGIIFISQSMLLNTPELLETLYHETLHIKWVNTLDAYKLINLNLIGETNILFVLGLVSINGHSVEQ